MNDRRSCESDDPQAGAAQSDGASATESMARLSHGLYRFVLVLAVALIVAKVVNRAEIGLLLDDAYMFQRYAHNLLGGDGLAWNPNGAPTYGMTAPLFVIPALLGRWLAGGNPSLGAALASMISGALFLSLAVRLLWTHVAASRATKLSGVLLLALCLAWSATPAHFTTGMDTTFALAYLAALLILAARFEQEPSRRRALVLGACGSVAFWVRPELTSFALALPGAMVLFSRRPIVRQYGASALGVTVGGLAMVLLLNWLYFASPLPLAFYAKSLSAYEGALARAYRGVASEHLAEFLRGWWPPLLIVGLDVGSRGRNYWRVATGLDKGALAATCVCALYYWLFALPVLADEQRFLQPVALPLAYLAARTLARWEQGLGPALRRVSRPAQLLGACGAMVLLLALLVPTCVDEAKRLGHSLSRRKWRWDGLRHAESATIRSYWFKLSEVTQLPDDLVIATTEVGLLGALNPRKTIIDMAGLNDPGFSRGPFDAERLLAERRPDWIYMPHEDYRPMVAALRQSPSFAGYEHFDKKRLQTRHFGVALRRDSAHYVAMRALVQSALPKPLRPAR